MSHRDFFMIGCGVAIAMFDEITRVTGVVMSGRLRNCLIAENIYTRERLMGLTQYHMRQIPNMGAKSIDVLLDIQRRLRVYISVVESKFVISIKKSKIRDRTLNDIRTRVFAVDDHTCNPPKTTWVVVERNSKVRSISYAYYSDAETLYAAYPDIAPKTKTMRVVVAAACRFLGDVIIVSSRHFDANMHAMIDTLMLARGLTDLEVMHNHEEGFVDQFGVWLTRGEALAVATESGQLNRYRPKRGHEGELFSEDLY